MSAVNDAGAGSTHRRGEIAGDPPVQPEAIRSLGLSSDAPILDPRALLDRLGDAEARERTLIAEAIHDDPLQLIVAAIMHVDLLGVRHPAAQQDGDSVISMLESAVDKLRALIVATIAPNFDGGLVAALRRLATGIFIGTSTTVRLTGPSHVQPTVEARMAAYRIVREALVNVRQHAFARHVSVTVVATDSTVVITVADDGIGCDNPRSGGGHLGLPAMHSRARAVSGRLRISSSTGAGMTVVLIVPAADPALIQALGLRIFLADDHPAGRHDLAGLINEKEDLAVVGQASSITDALEQIHLYRPDVLVTDLLLRDGTGMDLLSRARRISPRLQCLVLASRTDGSDVAAALRAGVSGYLTRDSDLADVVAAVRTVAGGRSVFDSRVAAMLIDGLCDG